MTLHFLQVMSDMKAAIASVLLAFVFPTAVYASSDVFVYRGTSDASAAVAVGEDTFVVADDENNVLRVYHLGGGLPAASYDLTAFLEVDQEHPEADIEGATKVGDRIYWITSHGRNKDGKLRPSRYRFFSTMVKIENDRAVVQPIGKPYKDLVHRLIKTEAGQRFNLNRATCLDARELDEKEHKKLAPKREGLNIEGLCASADGKVLYIGFRNPRPMGKALVLPLINAEAVIEQGDEPAFGDALLWDLSGFGLRSMEYSPFHKTYFIVAGRHDEGNEFALYRWSGKKDGHPILLRKLSSSYFCPEALICFENSSQLLLLSDDGTVPIKILDTSECKEGELNKDGTCPNKFLIDSNRKTFRAMWLEP